MKKLLFITNGHGEDLVAVEFIKRLRHKAEISVLPVVGEGQAFAGLDVSLLGSPEKLPSGGFSLRNFKYLFQDLSAGLLGQTSKKVQVLKNKQGVFDLVVAIGDIVPIIGALFTKAPFIFVGVNKSSYYKKFGLQNFGEFI